MSQEQEYLDAYRLEEAGSLVKQPFPEDTPFGLRWSKRGTLFSVTVSGLKYWSNEISRYFVV